MLKTNVTLLKTLYGEGSIAIFADNAKLFYEGQDKQTIIWDDTHEMIHTIRPNVSHYNQDKQRMIVESTEYTNIQYLYVTADREKLNSILTELKTQGIIDDAIIAKVLNDYDVLSNKLL